MSDRAREASFCRLRAGVERWYLLEGKFGLTVSCVCALKVTPEAPIEAVLTHLREPKTPFDLRQ